MIIDVYITDADFMDKVDKLLSNEFNNFLIDKYHSEFKMILSNQIWRELC